MGASTELREKLKLLPRQPGVYLMKDARGDVIYVGKARDLRSRVRSYFQSESNLPDARVRALVGNIVDFDYIVTDSEIEALILESNLIKEHSPRYNVRLRDDKHYPYLKLSLQEDYPRLSVVRRRAEDGARYFGPYTDSRAVRSTIQQLRKFFPIRTCGGELHPDESKRPCLNYFIDRCLGPCASKCSAQEYREVVRQVELFLEGRQAEIIPAVRREMETAAAELDFERAARLRDRLQALQKIVERQKIVTDLDDDHDVIGLAAENGDACVQVFFVRAGKIVGREKFMLAVADDTPSFEVLEGFVEQFYSASGSIPRRILLPAEVESRELLEEWLGGKRQGRVYLQVPQRGEKRRLVEMVSKNAALALQEYLEKKELEIARRMAGLRQLRDVLSLSHLPRRIEGYDISNIQGSEAVGSMVVFREGRPDPASYRRFRIREVEGANDYAMLQETVRRRLIHGLRELDETDDGASQEKFVELPDLVLIDGGKGQLNSVLRVMEEVGCRLPIVSLAKEEELVFVPGDSAPLRLEEDSPGLQILQQVRDEAHRFAVGYHRRVRTKTRLRSVLDDIRGVGPKRRKQLIEHFGSAAAVARAELEELRAVPGLPEKVAQRIYEELHAPK